MQPKRTLFFPAPSAFRKWLEKNHDKKTEVFVGFYKKETGKQTITWSEAVDQAICFGWIDGVRYSIDDKRYCNRFTPRKPSSNWSGINIEKVKNLTKQGLMHPAGIAAYEKRKASQSKIYSYEKEPDEFPPACLKKLKANKKAWAYFQKLAPSYKRLSVHWVMGAKQETTQQKRLKELIRFSAAGTNPWKDNKYTKKG